MRVTEGSGFLDSNVVLYLLSADASKADRVERLLKTKPVISVQVLNEVTHVCRRKLGMRWEEITEFTKSIYTNNEEIDFSYFFIVRPGLVEGRPIRGSTGSPRTGSIQITCSNYVFYQLV